MLLQFSYVPVVHTVCGTSSPDFNPIEKMFANIKAWCRTNFDEMSAAGMADVSIIDEAFRYVTVDGINRLIAHNQFNPPLGL